MKIMTTIKSTANHRELIGWIVQKRNYSAPYEVSTTFTRFFRDKEAAKEYYDSNKGQN